MRSLRYVYRLHAYTAGAHAVLGASGTCMIGCDVDNIDSGVISEGRVEYFNTAASFFVAN